MAAEEQEPTGPDSGLTGLDQIIEAAFGKSGDEVAPEPVAPDDEDATEDFDEEEPEDEGSDDEDEDDSDDEAGDEEPEDEDEEEEEDEDEEEEEEDEDPLNVSAQDLERIQGDPGLSKAYKAMVRAFTAKTSAVATRDREVSAKERIITDFESTVRTPAGMANYLAQTMERFPVIVGAAFESVATGDKAKDFLVAVGEAHPEVFDEAYERVQELLSDDDERKRYTRQRDLQSKDAELTEREERIRRSTFSREYQTLITAAEKEIKRLGLEPDDMEDVRARLKEKLTGQVRPDGTITLRPQDAKTVVKEVKATKDRLYEKAMKQLERKKVSESREATKKKARKAKAPRGGGPPQSAGRKAPKEHTRYKHDGRGDPLDSFIDYRLG